MADLEGLTRALMKKGAGKEEIINTLIREYKIYKNLPDATLRKMAEAVYYECLKSNPDPYKIGSTVYKILEIPEAGIDMGTQGVGCRGLGDFFVHKLLGEISSTDKRAYLAPSSLDDAGAVFIPPHYGNIPADRILVVSKMEGMHSRLSDFPFIAGFHVTRAALRDLLVKGAEPISVFVDIHLADDADVGKLFDFMAGVAAVCELTEVPITGGSTLRIGGDMVIGTRITGGIGAVGITTKLFARRNIKKGDKIIMTEGAGGGTVATTAIYSGNHDALEATLNIKFLDATRALLNSEYTDNIHAMCDVTNGGLRGDLYEINYEAGTGVTVYEEKIRDLVDPVVMELFEKTGVDYLGVSLDALLIYCENNVAEDIIEFLKKKAGVKAHIIGETDDSGEVKIVDRNGVKNILPRFRESAYTAIKKVIGEDSPESIDAINSRLKASVEKALEKKKFAVEFIRRRRS